MWHNRSFFFVLIIIIFTINAQAVSMETSYREDTEEVDTVTTEITDEDIQSFQVLAQLCLNFPEDQAEGLEEFLFTMFCFLKECSEKSVITQTQLETIAGYFEINLDDIVCDRFTEEEMEHIRKFAEIYNSAYKEGLEPTVKAFTKIISKAVDASILDQSQAEEIMALFGQTDDETEDIERIKMLTGY